MSNFVVSARKYRPRKFNEVVGQEHVTSTLQNALATEHLAHAFLFCGPRGVGKTTCARILAKTINCENLTKDNEPCDECTSCTSFNNQNSFNIVELDAASNNSVDHIRALIEQVRFQPQSGKYKVFIIDEVHMLTTSAFNAFLKTLEEPPSYAIFILATTEKHKILPTILSRCQIYDFNRVSVDKMVVHLQEICKIESISAESEALHIIAEKADGALRDSLSIFDRIISYSGKSVTYQDAIKNLNVLDYDFFFKITEALLVEDVAEVLLVFDDILKRGFEEQVFLNGLMGHFRNLLVAKKPSAISLLQVGESIKERYISHGAPIPLGVILSWIHIASSADVNYKLSKNKRLHIETSLIKMTYAGRAIDLSAGSHQKKNSKPSKVVQKPLVAPSPPVSTPQKQVAEKTPPVSKQTTESVVKAPVEPNPEPKSKPKPEPQPNTKPKPVADVPKTEAAPLPQSDNHKKKIINPSEKSYLQSAASSLSTSKSLLDQIKSTVQKDINEHKSKKSILSPENLKKVWDEYVESIESVTVTASYQQARYELQDKLVFITVPLPLNEGAIKSDKKLLSYLRDKLHDSGITIEVVVDKSLVKEKKETKPKTTEQIYLAMKEANPEISELYNRFELKPKNI